MDISNLYTIEKIQNNVVITLKDNESYFQTAYYFFHGNRDGYQDQIDQIDRMGLWDKASQWFNNNDLWEKKRTLKKLKQEAQHDIDIITDIDIPLDEKKLKEIDRIDSRSKGLFLNAQHLFDQASRGIEFLNCSWSGKNLRILSLKLRNSGTKL